MLVKDILLSRSLDVKINHGIEEVSELRNSKSVKNCKSGDTVQNHNSFEFGGATVGINSSTPPWICGQVHGQELL